jgi:hypothetical protein
MRFFPGSRSKAPLGVASAWIVFFIILIGEFSRVPRGGGTMYDLEIMLTGANRLVQNQNAFRIEEADEFKSNPFIAVLLLPLTKIARPGLYFGWALVFIASFVYSIKLSGLSFFSWTGALAGFSILQFLIPEIKGGQINLFILTLLLIELKDVLKWPGVALAVALILKPTNLIFLPFFLGRTGRRIFPGLLSVVLFFSLAYIVLVGPTAWVRDQISWLRFLPAAGTKHLFQADNLGLLAGLAEKWPATAGYFGIITLISLGLGYYWGRCSKQNVRYYFGTTCVVTTLLSPVAWMQNFLFCLPLVAYFLNRRSDRTAWTLFGVYFLLTQLINFTFVGRYYFELSIHWKIISIATLFLGAAAQRSKLQQLRTY